MKGNDDVPLCRLKDIYSYNHLSQKVWEHCEFCEKIFGTRLEIYKHNASHIIIPLLNLKVHQCDECLHHFTSIEDLRTHATTKNHTTSQLKTSPYNEVLQSMIEKQLIVKCQDLASQVNIVQDNEAPIEISSGSDRSSPIDNNYRDNIREPSSPGQCEVNFESNLQEPSSPDNCEINIESIRSRLMFEDDYDDDLFASEEILPDKTYPKISCVVGNVQVGDRSENRSVHYSELVEPEVCDCRYCGRCFGNRLELIKHESTHMKVTKTLPILCYVCEKYLSGNHWTLRKHLQKYHPTQERKLAIHKCKYCQLNYHNYQKHVNLYHLVTCKVCNRRVDQRKFNDHECYEPEQIITETIIKLCEMCLTFTKNRLNVHHEVIGEHSEIGTFQQCSKCLAKYFEVKLIKRRVKAGPDVEGKWKRKCQPVTNMERLKKIQNRLKMINKMNK